LENQANGRTTLLSIAFASCGSGEDGPSPPGVLGLVKGMEAVSQEALAVQNPIKELLINWTFIGVIMFILCLHSCQNHDFDYGPTSTSTANTVYPGPIPYPNGTPNTTINQPTAPSSSGWGQY